MEFYCTLKSVLILYGLLLLDLWNFFSFRFPHQNPVRIYVLPHMSATRLLSLFLLRTITHTVPSEEHTLCSSSLCTFLRSNLTSCPLRPKYLHQLPVLEHPQPMSSLNVTDHVSHPYKTAGTFTLIFIGKRSTLDVSRNFLHFIYSQFARVFPNVLNSGVFSKELFTCLSVTIMDIGW